MRYESPKGKHWAEFTETHLGYGSIVYGYASNNGGGSFGPMGHDEALAAFVAKVESGLFLPDKAKTPMKLVA